MFAWFADSMRHLARLLRHRGGASATEFALALPVVVLLLTGVTEVGRMLYQSSALEKGVRAGALYAGRVEAPVSAADLNAAANVVKTGDPNGSGDYRLPGFSDPAAKVNVSVADYDLNGQDIPVITVIADVPFSPLMPSLAALYGLDSYVLHMEHQQAHVGY